MTNVSVEHQRENKRYVGFIDGEEAGFAAYSENGTHRNFFQTVTHDGYTGKGVAGQIVGHALSESVKDGFTFTPSCSYVEHYIGKHPEYAEHVK